MARPSGPSSQLAPRWNLPTSADVLVPKRFTTNRFHTTKGEFTMATLIQAIAAYRPRVLEPRTVGLDVLAARLVRGSLVTRSIARMVLEDLSDEVAAALAQGDAVRLPGIGRIGVTLSLGGEVRPTFRVDTGLRRRMPPLAEYGGTILNRANAGMTLAELVARWDEEHPDDPIELPPGVNLAA